MACAEHLARWRLIQRQVIELAARDLEPKVQRMVLTGKQAASPHERLVKDRDQVARTWIEGERVVAVLLQRVPAALPCDLHHLGPGMVVDCGRPWNLCRRPHAWQFDATQIKRDKGVDFDLLCGTLDVKATCRQHVTFYSDQVQRHAEQTRLKGCGVADYVVAVHTDLDGRKAGIVGYATAAQVLALPERDGRRMLPHAQLRPMAELLGVAWRAGDLWASDVWLDSEFYFKQLAPPAAAPRRPRTRRRQEEGTLWAAR